MSGSAPPTPPLFRFDRLLDPGWPFVLAGLALLVAGILIPAQRELHDLRNEWKKVEAEESRMYGRLEAYDRFLSDVRHGEPHLIRRLAAAQLNRVPEGEEPVLLTPGMNQTVAEWIDESVPLPRVTADPYPDTLLGRIALGPNRLWLLASSVFLLFVGLLLAPESPSRTDPRDRTRGWRRCDSSGQTSARHGDGTNGTGQTSAHPAHPNRLTYSNFLASAEFEEGPPHPAPASMADRSSVDEDESEHSAADSRPVLVIDDADAAAADDEVIDVEIVVAADAADLDSAADGVGIEPLAEAAACVDLPHGARAAASQDPQDQTVLEASTDEVSDAVESRRHAAD